MSWKCSCMKIRTLLHKWFQPIVYCVLPDVIIFLTISGTEYWEAINLCQHLLILITWQVFGNLNLLETNITVFYFQSVSNEINSACWFFIEFGVHIIFMYFQLAAEKKTSFLTGISFFFLNIIETGVDLINKKFWISSWIIWSSRVSKRIKKNYKWISKMFFW